MDKHPFQELVDSWVYPCYVVAYGPDRDYRTRFRSEHGAAFSNGMADNSTEAIDIIDRGRYLGHYSEMTIIRVYIQDGILEVEEHQ